MTQKQQETKEEEEKKGKEGEREGTACSHLPAGSGWGRVTYGHQQSQARGSSLATHLRRSLALSEAREVLQVLSSGLLRAVGLVWSSTVRSLPCFHSS